MLRFRSSSFALGLILAVSALTGKTAHAFCRTTTEKSPPDFDSTQNGCWGKGLPLFWQNACIGYSMHSAASKKISYELATNAMAVAFTRWTGATCPTDGKGRSRTSIDVRDLGPAECSKIEYSSFIANQNVIAFRDETWKHGPSVLGLTIVNYNPSSGEIYGADMEFNNVDMEPLATRDPVDSSAYDFASVAAHEAGHFLGIAHSDVEGATMFARYNTGQTSMRNLAPDDIAAICTVYRPDGDRAVLNGKVTQAPQCDPTPRGGYATECQEKRLGCNAVGSRGASLGGFAPVALAVGVMLRRRRGHGGTRTGAGVLSRTR
jgi:uncharacterized protein (TIGR03382 family)